MRVLINESTNIQELFNTDYLRAEFGSYDSIEKTVQGWKDMAERYHFSLKSFPYIFFHSMCIVKYKIRMSVEIKKIKLLISLTSDGECGIL